MNNILLRNTANIIVVLRSALVFVIIVFLSLNSLVWKVIGLGLLIFIAILDWIDGYVARKHNISSKIGGLIDTLGDRITENLLLIFFAYKQLIPIAVPLIFVARSFIADFIRYQAYQSGIGTFTINKSKLGIFFVSSRASRVLYLVFKIVIFFLGGAILVAESLIAVNRTAFFTLLMNLKQIMFSGAILLVLFNLLRFILLIYDSRFILKEVFTK